MTDTDTTAPVEDDAVVSDDEQDATPKIYEVRAAAARYFVKEPINGPDGVQMKDAKGDPLYTLHAEIANKGQLLTLPDYQAAALLKDDIIQEVGSAPIYGIHENAPLYATPFSGPVIDSETGKPVNWAGPVMGDPNPAGPGTPDIALTTGAAGGAFTPEQLAELMAAQRKMNGEGDPDVLPGLTDDEQASFDGYKEMDKSDLLAEASERKLEIVRRDGRTDLEPRVEDLAYALAKDDAAHEGGGED
jgi:hypothetical protein